MSTSDLPTVGGIDLTDLSDAQSIVPAGLPDPAQLAKLATELFRGVPTTPSIEGVTLPATLPSIPSPQPTGGKSGETTPLPNIHQLPPSALPPDALTAGLPTPGIIGGVSPGDFSNVPSFSFIQDARSLFSAAAPSATTAIPSSTIKIPTETELRDLPDLLSGKPPKIPTSIPDLTTPAIPGAVTHAIPSQDLTRGFLENARPLAPVNTIPSLAPLADTNKAAADLSSVPFDVSAIRRDFPILQERVNGRQLIWLDNAATTQKPQAVIDRLAYFYAHENSNIHRAAHTLAARATDAYEAAREKVRRFLNASSAREIIFVRGATEGINLVAQSWGRRNVQKDDEIVITHLEHHANIVPWQMLCAEKGARLRVAPVDNTGQVILEEYEKLLGPRTRLVSLAHVSNALGTVTPAREMTAMAHRHGARVLIDGAQSVSHMQVDLQALDCDFFVFSGHKIFAPTGIGVVFGKEDLLNQTPPWQGGGNMIADVTFEKTVYNPTPSRFEAGTGNIADAVGLGAAFDYLNRVGMHNIARYEHDLLLYATDALKQIPGLHLIGTAREKASVLSFILDGFRTEDVGTALNHEGIAVRSGHHCAQPILRRFGTESTVRPSLAFYNTCEEVDALINALWKLKGGRNSGPI